MFLSETATASAGPGSTLPVMAATGTRQLTAVITHEGDWYVAQCVEVNVASQGRTPAEAIDALREALELRFEGEDLPELPQVERFEVAV